MEPRILKELGIEKIDMTGLDGSRHDPPAWVDYAVTAALYVCPLTLYAIVGVFAANGALQAWHLPLWLGIVCGVGAAILCHIVVAAGDTLLLEIAIKCAVILALGLILWPIFAHARALARQTQRIEQRRASPLPQRPP